MSAQLPTVWSCREMGVAGVLNWMKPLRRWFKRFFLQFIKQGYRNLPFLYTFSKLIKFQSIPISNNAYISKFSDNSVTISGPPSTLSLFSGSFPLTSTNRKELDVYGLYHASHLYTKTDVDLIMSSDSRIIRYLDQHTSRFSILSTSTGSWFDSNISGSNLFTSVLSDILIQPLRIPSILNACAQAIANLKVSKCKLLSYGSPEFQDTLLAYLKLKTTVEISPHSESLEKLPPTEIKKTPASGRRSKLAIVGMAGRFPNAADHEKFWSLLEAGLDVHKKVTSSGVIR